MEKVRLGGRTAIITGATGHIGRLTARTFAELDCDLILTDRRHDLLADVAEGIEEEFEVNVEVIDSDLESDKDREKLIDKIQGRGRSLDILINNAAFVGDDNLHGWTGSLEEQTIETWRRALEVNLTAVFHISKELSPLLSVSGKGSIVNVSSIYGLVGPDLSLYEGTSMGSPAGYAASKGGLIQLTRWLSTVLAPNVRVNCISPGGIERSQPTVFKDRYIQKTPLRRLGTEKDVIGSIVFLSGDLSEYVTGQNIVIDGGWTAW